MGAEVVVGFGGGGVPGRERAACSGGGWARGCGDGGRLEPLTVLFEDLRLEPTKFLRREFIGSGQTTGNGRGEERRWNGK